MNDITIRVLGRNAKEIGNNLENLSKELLARLGFGSFIRNAHKTGAEIDLKARHRVTGSPLICECKARADQIDSNSIKIFYAEWDKQHNFDERLHGIVISTSGYIGTAIQWHEELDEKKRKYFKIIGPEELLTQLIDTQLTLPPQAIVKILVERGFWDDPYQHLLTYSSHGLAWVFVYQVDGRPRFHTIVDGEAKPLPTWKCREIAELLWKKTDQTELFGLDLRRKVQIELLGQEGKSISALSESIQESETDIRMALDILKKESRIQEEVREQGKEQNFRFRRDVIPFANIARDFLNKTQDAVIFLSSNYAKEMIKSPEVEEFIDSRYHLEMSSDERKSLASILLISPNALSYALFADTEPYIRTEQEISEKISDPDEKQQWMEMHRTSLLQALVPYAVRDIIGSEYSLSNHLFELGVKRYRIKTGIDATGPNWKLFVHGTMFCAVEKAEATIAAGSIVYTTDPVGHAMLDGLFYLEVREFEQAEKELLKAHDLCHQIGVETKIQQAVLSNLALALMGQNRWEDALRFLDDAFNLGEPEFPELISNREICIEHLDRSTA